MQASLNLGNRVVDHLVGVRCGHLFGDGFGGGGNRHLDGTVTHRAHSLVFGAQDLVLGGLHAAGNRAVKRCARLIGGSFGIGGA